MKKYEIHVSLLGIFMFMYVILHMEILFLRQSGPVDFETFYSCVSILLEGVNPYSVGNSLETGWNSAPVFPPGIFLFLIPFLAFPLKAAILAVFVINFCMYAFSVFLLFNKLGIYSGRSIISPVPGNIPYWVIIFLIFNSSPFISALTQGQVSIGVLFFLTVLLFTKYHFIGNLLFGCAAALKFSLLVFFAPFMLLKGKFSSCIYGFLCFIALTLAPGFLIDGGPVELISGFISTLSADIEGGFNSFSSNACGMLQFELFKNNSINVYVKTCVIAGVIFVYISEWRKSFTGEIPTGKGIEKWLPDAPLSLHAVMFLLCATLLVSHQLISDLATVVPFLAAVCGREWQNGKRVTFSLYFAFILLLTIPTAKVLEFCDWTGGRFPELESYVYLGSSASEKLYHIMPVFPFVILLLTMLAGWNWFRTKNSPEFPLRDTK